MATPRIATMRERLTVLERTATTDSQGGRAVTWSTRDTLAASLVPIRASERLQAQAIQAELDYRFRVHTRSDLDSTMRVTWRPSWADLSTPKTLEVHGVLPDAQEPTRYLWLDCGEVEA